MSDLSDEIESVFNTLASKDGVEVVDARNCGELGAPHIDSMVEYHSKTATRAIRKAYRKNAGGKPFESTYTAALASLEMMPQYLLPVIIGALADGVQMGQQKTFAFRKFKLFNQLNKAFSSDAFRSESDMIGLTVMADQDAKDRLEMFLKITFFNMGKLTGYANGTSQEEINKIWDVWFLTTKSLTVAAYESGYKLGGQWREKEILEGIISASQGGQE